MSRICQVHRFFTEYRPDGSGGLRGVDMVDYGPIGKPEVRTIEVVSRLAKLVDKDGTTDDPANQAAFLRWKQIGAEYEDWKRGHETPADGTPLGAWAGITAEQAEVFRARGLRTVEELADAGDGIITKVPLPGIREIQANAKRFVESVDRNKAAAEIAKRDDQISAMQAQMKEMMETIRGLAPADGDKPKRRGPGRRPKSAPPDAEAA